MVELPEEWSCPDLQAALKQPGLTVAVHGVDWMPSCRNSLLAALEVAGKVKYAHSRVPTSIVLIDDCHQWQWAKNEQLLVGTPCIFFYFEQKKIRMNHQPPAASLPCQLTDHLASTLVTPQQRLRDDRYTGHFSPDFLSELIRSALEAIASRPPNGDPKPMEVPNPADYTLHNTFKLNF